MRWYKPVLWTVLGVLLGFPVFSMTYYTMVRTSTPGFCASCHEIRPAWEAWKTSTHANNAQGFVADCMDCHLPAPHDTVNFFYSKTYHGIKDVLAHVLMSDPVAEYDRAAMRERAYASFRNEQCQKCHRNILHLPDNRGAMLAHRTVLYARPGYERKCVDCHRNLVHVDRPYHQFRELAPPYRATGLNL